MSVRLSISRPLENHLHNSLTLLRPPPMPIPIGMPAIPGCAALYAIIPAPAVAAGAAAAAVAAAAIPACACSMVCGGRDAALEMAPDTPEGWVA